MIDKNSSYAERKEILDYFGEVLVEKVRDKGLKAAMNIAKMDTINPIALQYYDELRDLTTKQQELVCDLLSETITDVLFRFLNMFEENRDKMELIIRKDGECHNMVDISEKMGSEITFDDEDGWIQKYSKIGRFVL
jgi:hypothetical protein